MKYLKSNKRWFSIKNILSSASGKPKMALCSDNRGIWRFILKYSITVHQNRLVLEQWTKRWMTISSSKLQNEQIEVFCLRNKKSLWFWLFIVFSVSFFFQWFGIACTSWIHLKYKFLSILNSWVMCSHVLNFPFYLIRSLTKFMFFSENFLWKTTLLSIFIKLLNHRYWETMVEGREGWFE